MDVKLIALIVSVVMPIVMFLLYALSERVKNRNQIVLEIKSGDRGNFDINKRLSFFKNLATGEFDINKWLFFFKNLKVGEFDINKKLPFLKNLETGEFDKDEFISGVFSELSKSSPYINITIVNTGRVPITVQELNINFSEMSSSESENPSSEKEARILIRVSEKLRFKRIAQWLSRKKRGLISVLTKPLPKKTVQWLGRKEMLQMIDTSKVSYYSFLQRGKMLRLEPGESETLEISKEGIKWALDVLDSNKWLVMVYPSCKLVGEEKIRQGLPIFYSLLPVSLSEIELKIPIAISMQF